MVERVTKKEMAKQYQKELAANGVGGANAKSTLSVTGTFEKALAQHRVGPGPVKANHAAAPAGATGTAPVDQTQAQNNNKTPLRNHARNASAELEAEAKTKLDIERSRAAMLAASGMLKGSASSKLLVSGTGNGGAPTSGAKNTVARSGSEAKFNLSVGVDKFEQVRAWK